jgi:hypothetical protein
MSNQIIPDAEDFQAIESEYGRLPPNASDDQRSRHYCFALTLKMVRLYEHGQLPLGLMREMDKIRAGE